MLPRPRMFAGLWPRPPPLLLTLHQQPLNFLVVWPLLSDDAPSSFFVHAFLFVLRSHVVLSPSYSYKENSAALGGYFPSSSWLFPSLKAVMIDLIP